MTTHRADRGTRTVALTDLADPPTLPSLPAAELLIREGLPTKASRSKKVRGRAVALATGAVAIAGLFSVVHDNLLDHPTPARPPATPRTEAAVPRVVAPATAVHTDSVVTTPELQQPPVQAAPAPAPARQPAAPKPAPTQPATQQPGWQQWIPPFVNQWWPR